jgi:hypothetical protein
MQCWFRFLAKPEQEIGSRIGEIVGANEEAKAYFFSRWTV